MPKQNVYLHALNVGVQDALYLPRTDLARMQLAAEDQTNILPLSTGPAFLRPGLGYLSMTDSNDVCRLKEFVYGATDAVLMEFSDFLFRVKVADTTVTRPAVTAAVGTGTFAADASWSKAATTGATVTISGGYLNLTALARGSRASATQTIAVNEVGTEHALRVVVERGPVTLRVGSTSGGDEYINETVLRTGTHSLAFTPTGANFYIELFSKARSLKRVDSVVLESAGIMTLPTLWAEASLDKIRFAQSADVVFCGCDGYRPQRIERRSNRSWSIVNYQPDDGPFTIGVTRDVKLTSSVTEGNGTLTASAAFFNAAHVGTLFSLFHEGFNTTTQLAANNEFTDPFKVTGVGTATNYNDRNWKYTVTGTWVGTLNWYRSFDGPTSGFKKFRKADGSGAQDITGNVAGVGNSDDDDNAIIWYKLGFDSYTSGTATVAISYDGGGGSGICRVVAFNSATSVDIEVLSPFQGTAATADWRECEWSDNQVWPSAVAFSDGRLFWSGEDRFWGSVSDAFDSFDDTIEGDSAPISRSIATGGVNNTQWLLSLGKLTIGTEGATTTAKSSSLDEPITATNLTLRDSSTIGAAPVEPAKIDTRGLFVGRDNRSIYELTFDGQSSDYVVTLLSKLTTLLFASGVKAVSVQRRPDTRVWFVMDDGSAVCAVYEPMQEVLAFIPVVTDGTFESVAALPADAQDRVYFSIARTVNGSTVRYIEKMALDSEAKPGTLCKIMDAYVSGVNGPASATISGATHLVGETVRVWADGLPVDGEFTVSGAGTITLPLAVTNWVYGLYYRGRYKSARLAYAAAGGTAMLQQKRVDELGMILTDFARAGITYGAEFDNAYRPLDPLPVLNEGVTADAIVSGTIHEERPYVFPGDWHTDSRVCIECGSPYPVTFVALSLAITTNG